MWSVIKPLALFTLLYLVFGRIFNLGDVSEYYPLGLLIGIVLFGFFDDASSLGMTSIVANARSSAGSPFPARSCPLRHGHRRDHLRCQRRRRRRVHRLKGIAAARLAADRAAAARALRLRRRRLVHPLDAVRLPARHRPGLGARAATALLRLADHLPDRLPAAVGATSHSSTRSRRSSRTSALVLYPDVAGNKVTARRTRCRQAALPIAVALGTFAFGLLLLRRHEPRFAERV